MDNDLLSNQSDLQEVDDHQSWEEEYRDEVLKLAEKYNIPKFILISTHPKEEDTLMVASKGNKLELASVTASYVRQVRQEINERLAT